MAIRVPVRLRQLTSYASYLTSYAHCTFILFDVASLTPDSPSPSPSPFPSRSHIRIGLVSAAHRDKTMMCPFTYLRVPKVVAAHLGVTPVMHAR